MSAKVRDTVLLALGSIMLLYMLFTKVEPLLVAAALAVLGIPTGLQARAVSQASRGRGRSSGSASRSSRRLPSSSSPMEVSGEHGQA